jgi:hypothetical protein
MQRHSIPSFDEAARAWNAAHPLTQPPRRVCPICEDKSFDILADGMRWVCYSSARPHTVGRPVKGNDARWTGDALDLEAFRLRVDRGTVLRECGYLAPAGRVARVASPPPAAPMPPPPPDPHARWGRLSPGDGARDLVRRDPAVGLVVRCFSRDGRAVAIRAVCDLPAGWFGTTPATARAVLVEGGPGRFLAPAAFLAGDTEGEAVVLCTAPVAELRRRVSAAHVDRVDTLARALDGRVDLVELLDGSEVRRG